MARVNAFLRAGNDNGRAVSVGGRGASDGVWADLNTDNATHSDCGMRVTADVCGPGVRSKERRLKSVGDGRRSVFHVTLPRQADEYCEVHIHLEGDHLREVARLADSIRTMEQARELLWLVKAETTAIPNVNLPGGVTLKHALACVKIVQDLIAGETAAN